VNSFIVTFKKPGTYHYQCLIYPHGGDENCGGSGTPALKTVVIIATMPAYSDMPTEFYFFLSVQQKGDNLCSENVRTTLELTDHLKVQLDPFLEDRLQETESVPRIPSRPNIQILCMGAGIDLCDQNSWPKSS
jgi:hypothetical protein